MEIDDRILENDFLKIIAGAERMSFFQMIIFQFDDNSVTIRNKNKEFFLFVFFTIPFI